MAKMWSACPKCGCDDWDKIYCKSIEVDSDAMWKGYECPCGFAWQEVFIFSHNETPFAEELDDEGNVIENITLDITAHGVV